MNIEKFLSSLFLPCCISCFKSVEPGIILCENCFIKISPLNPPFCKICGVQLLNSGFCGRCLSSKPPFKKCISVFPYEGIMKELIKKGKYGQGSWIFYKLGILISPILDLIDPDYIIAVPSNRKSWLKRGFSTTKYIIKGMLKGNRNFNNDIFLKNSVIRVDNREPQVLLNFKERVKLSYKDFEIIKPVPSGKVLIVDDIYTTGATMRALSKKLKSSGVKEIYCVTIARTINN
jgi:ComF family protein